MLQIYKVWYVFLSQFKNMTPFPTKL